jgi:gluconate 2-dehydrogenase gamma chain
VSRAYKLSRRRFLQAALVAAAASGTGIGCGRTNSPWRFLTVDEAKTLAAACDQIIPPDKDAGAAWAGVVNFIDRQLCGPYRRLQNSYRHGLAAMNKSSRLLYGGEFSLIQDTKQIELLSMMEKGEVPPHLWQQISSAEFLGLLVDHTMQGFYGDPRHGGNRQGAGWKVVGLAYPPIRGRLKYDINNPDAAGLTKRSKAAGAAGARPDSPLRSE